MQKEITCENLDYIWFVVLAMFFEELEMIYVRDIQFYKVFYNYAKVFLWIK